MILKEEINIITGVQVSLYDKTKKKTSYNYLVEVAKNGRTTSLSKFYTKKGDAEKYYSEMSIKFID